MSAPEIRRNTKHPDSSKLDPGFYLCGYTASQYWRLKPPFQERVRHFCFAAGSPAGRRLCCLGVSGAGVRSCVGTQQRNKSETARATGVVLRSRTRSALAQTRQGQGTADRACTNPTAHALAVSPGRGLPRPLSKRNQQTSISRATSHPCFFAAFCQAPAAGRLRASNPQIAARNPRFP